MAKHICAICGAEIGLLTEQKLADGNHICRKLCAKKCYKELDLVSSDLDTVRAHHTQIDFGTKAWNQIFVPLKKTKSKEEMLKQFGRGEYIYVSPSTGLIAYTEDRFQFFLFGKTTFACVYRIADLCGYEFEEETKTGPEGKEIKEYYCRLQFRNTEGLHSFRIGMSGKKDFDAVCKYFDTLFGLEKTLGNMANRFTKQMNAAKSLSRAVMAAQDGSLNEEQANETIEALDTAVYGDRSALIEKADAALATVK